MRIASIFVVFVLAVSAKGQDVLTGKEIYRANGDAVVQIYAGNIFRGVGFFVSANGVIATANHVVTTRESQFKQYVADIKVLVKGRRKLYSATPIAAEVSADQVNYDSALLKIDASNLPQVALGDWSELEIGNPLVVIPSLPATGSLLVEGIVSSKGSARTDFGPKPVNIVIFQAPARNGFSGAPIFSSKGHVIGIQDTKVFGITKALDDLRTKWIKLRRKGSIQLMNIDIGANFLELINNLDQNLISGLGSGVDIAYAKQLRKSIQQQSK